MGIGIMAPTIDVYIDEGNFLEILKNIGENMDMRIVQNKKKSKNPPPIHKKYQDEHKTIKIFDIFKKDVPIYILEQSRRKTDRREIGSSGRLCSILSKTEGLEVLETFYEWYSSPTSDDDCGCPPAYKTRLLDETDEFALKVFEKIRKRHN